MTTAEPSGQQIYSPKIRDQSLVRKFIAQGGRGYLALAIVDGTPGAIGAPLSGAVDPDAGSLHLTVFFDDVLAQFPAAEPGTQVVDVDSSAITRTDTGMYYYELGPPLTAYRGVLTARWSYAINGVTLTFTDYAQILNQMPFWDSLNAQEQSIVEQVTYMVGDVFDSTEGGPQLIEPFQTHYDYERLARLEQLAINRFNFMSTFSNPPSSYGMGPGAATLPASLAGLLVIGTYLELVRHLVRSYVEIPAFPNTEVTYVDRRDYWQRWNQIFEQEWPEYQQMVQAAKIGMMNLGRGSLLVGGGIFGGSAMGLFQAGGYAAQTRSFRFYPAAPAISFGAMKH